MSERSDLGQAYLLERLGKGEEELYGLIRDIRRLVPGVSREQARAAAAKVELACGAVERMIRSDGEQSAYDELHAASDQLILLRAQLDRQLRETEREGENLGLEERRMRVRQLRDEIEKELGVAAGHGFGED